MPYETLSPELALVDPELAARARAALPDRGVLQLAPRPRAAPVAPPTETRVSRAYPLWARLTAALWLLVLGILIGGAAIPHAQDKPRVIPRGDEVPAAVCTVPQQKTPAAPVRPNRPFGP
jgi:hypothetical protein